MSNGLMPPRPDPIVPEGMDRRWFAIAKPLLLTAAILCGISYFLHRRMSYDVLTPILIGMPASAGAAWYQYRRNYQRERPAQLPADSEELVRLKRRHDRLKRIAHWSMAVVAVEFCIGGWVYHGLRNIMNHDAFVFWLMPAVLVMGVTEFWQIAQNAYIKSLEPKVKRRQQSASRVVPAGKPFQSDHWGGQ